MNSPCSGGLQPPVRVGERGRTVEGVARPENGWGSDVPKRTDGTDPWRASPDRVEFVPAPRVRRWGVGRWDPEQEEARADEDGRHPDRGDAAEEDGGAEVGADARGDEAEGGEEHRAGAPAAAAKAAQLDAGDGRESEDGEPDREGGGAGGLAGDDRHDEGGEADGLWDAVPSGGTGSSQVQQDPPWEVGATEVPARDRGDAMGVEHQGEDGAPGGVELGLDEPGDGDRAGQREQLD